MLRLTTSTLLVWLLSTMVYRCHGLAQVKVQVCQNKDCCQRFQGKAQNLVQSMQHLVPPNGKDQVEVESSGCLSQCGEGPNVKFLSKGDKEERFFGSVVDAASAGAVLEMADAGIQPNPTLVAAVNVMERAAQAPSLEEKERFLTSVITALQKKDELKECAAMAHAHAMRAEVRLEAGNVNDAVMDAQFATRFNPSNDKAWRTLADAYETTDNLQGAVEALRSWAKANPMFATKVNKEIQELKQRL